jgi:hypothetical protein
MIALIFTKVFLRIEYTRSFFKIHSSWINEILLDSGINNIMFEEINAIKIENNYKGSRNFCIFIPWCVLI